MRMVALSRPRIAPRERPGTAGRERTETTDDSCESASALGSRSAARSARMAAPGMNRRQFLATGVAALGVGHSSMTLLPDALAVAEAASQPFSRAWLNEEAGRLRSEEHTYELQSLIRMS